MNKSNNFTLNKKNSLTEDKKIEGKIKLLKKFINNKLK